MPEDMKEKINNNQLALLNELYKNEGVPAVQRYLVNHQGIEISVANRWIRALGFKDDSCKECFTPEESLQSYAHYCMFDNDTWVGPEGSLCPMCGTDGYNQNPNPVTHFINKMRAKIGI